MGITDISSLKPEGHNEELHVVGLKTGRPPAASCTCGWETAPNRELMELAKDAVAHAAETGHVLRKHNPVE